MKVEASFGGTSHFDNDLTVYVFDKNVEIFSLFIQNDDGSFFDEAYFTSLKELEDYAEEFGFDIIKRSWFCGLSMDGYSVDDFGTETGNVEFRYDLLRCYTEA